MSLFDFLSEEDSVLKNEAVSKPDADTESTSKFAPKRRKRVSSPKKLEPAQIESSKQTESQSRLEPSPQQPQPSVESALIDSGEPLSIGELTRLVKNLLENSFPQVWVVGEISNFSRSRPGHLYLTLKDETAQLPCAVWKSVASKLVFDLNDGMEVVCRGRLEVYPPQGKYQMIVSSIEPKGVGTLELAFRQLYDKLHAEGLFRQEKKRPIPSGVRTVAVITSPTGAAIHDFIQVLARRTQQVNIRIIPVKVQGEGAAQEIADAVALVNRFALADPTFAECIVLTRGGGSKEDLWAFNEEPLVRAVAASRLPTISAVGHEIDTSLCDLAADLRALTPSEAAERIAPEKTFQIQQLMQLRRRIEDSVLNRIRAAKERVRFFARQPVFERPMRLIDDRFRTLDLMEQNLDRIMDRIMERNRNHLSKSEATLQMLNPLAILRRGYTLTQTVDGTVLRSAEELRTGDEIQTHFHDGTVRSVVK